MTEVEFHTGVADKLGFACRLLRKAYRKGALVVVIGPAPLLGQLDRELWTFETEDFIPHLRLPAGEVLPASAQRTPIWLVDGVPPVGAPPVVINLGAAALADLAPFERLIEVLSDSAEDVEDGRQRWRDYRDRGLAVVHHPAR
ncbi:MAG: DNA polymerase III subunit chi [Rubrivivax sp.]|nr:DNA polymerase III subunit chi [Rubrivivax sp.]